MRLGRAELRGAGKADARPASRTASGRAARRQRVGSDWRRLTTCYGRSMSGCGELQGQQAGRCVFWFRLGTWSQLRFSLASAYSSGLRAGGRTTSGAGGHSGPRRRRGEEQGFGATAEVLARGAGFRGGGALPSRGRLGGGKAWRAWGGGAAGGRSSFPGAGEWVAWVRTGGGQEWHMPYTAGGGMVQHSQHSLVACMPAC